VLLSMLLHRTLLALSDGTAPWPGLAAIAADYVDGVRLVAWVAVPLGLLVAALARSLAAPRRRDRLEPMAPGVRP
jgi:hypothetical protein